MLLCIIVKVKEGMNMKNICEKQNELLHALLELDHEIVGVRFLHHETDYKNNSAQEILYKMPYCVMVKSALAGHRIKVKKENFGCMAAARALGFVAPKASFLEGKDGYSFGIYKDLETAKCSSGNITLLDSSHYGMTIAPLDQCKAAPDIIIMVTKPYNAMRMTQAYTYSFGNQNPFKMGGLQAMCSETTAYPMKTGNLNISMLCAGTRNLCHWKEEELAIGFPYRKLEAILTGLLQTLNPLERNHKKQIIQDKFEALGIAPIPIQMNRNYDDNLYEFGKNGRR